jgi:hypothetical protein
VFVTRIGIPGAGTGKPDFGRFLRGGRAEHPSG